MDEGSENTTQTETQPTSQSPITSGLNKARGHLGNNKKKYILSGVGGAIMIAVVAFFLLFLAGFKLNHIKNLFISYQFAAFHRSIAKRMSHVIVEDAILSSNSAGLPEGKGKSLYQKLRVYNSKKALTTLGMEGVDLDFEKRTLRSGKLRAITDPETGTTYARQGASDIPDGATVVSESELLARTKSIIDTQGRRIDKNFLWRRGAVDDVFRRSGIRLAKFKAWNGKDLIADEETGKALRQEQLDDSTKFESKNGEIKQKAEDLQKATVEGDEAGIKKVRGDINGLAGKAKFFGNVSTFVFVATIYCIIRDVAGSLENALDARSDNMIKVASDLATRADQQKAGEASAQQINEANKQYDGFEESAAYQRAAGVKVTGEDLNPNDHPQTIFGFKPDVLKPFMFLVGADNVVINSFCSAVLNPVVQAVTGLVEIGLLIVSLGGTEVGARGIVEVLKIAAKAAGGIAISEYIFGHVLPGWIEDVSGVSSAGIQGSVDRANRVDAGTNLLKNEVALSSGAHPVSDQVAAGLTRVALEEAQELSKSKGLAYRLFNLENPFSTTSRLLAQIPTTKSGLAKKTSAMVATINPLNFFALFATPAHAEGLEVNYYEIQQYGWEDAEVDATNQEYSFSKNTAFVEANFDRLKEKYGKCFSSTVGQRLMNDDYGFCEQTGGEEGEELKRYGMYILDCYTVEELVKVTTDDDSFTASECRDLSGAFSG